MNEIWKLSAIDTATAVADGKLSAAEVVTAHLERMSECNPRLNAVTMDLSNSARLAAAAADRTQRQGEPLGPLHGVPVTIKENVDQEGLCNANGISAFVDNIAPADAPLVRNLKQAGAIIIGRTNTPEFSFRYFSDNPLRGNTSNPWDASRTPGGSSGGAAAALAAGIGCIAHGSDLAGSLRYPAYCCGLATIRPSLGRVPAYNPSAAAERPPALQLMSVHGPIGRTVADVRLALEIMSRDGGDDPWWVPVPIAFDAPKRRRVAIADGRAFGDVAPAIVAAVRHAADILADAGYDVVEIDPPAPREAGAFAWSLIQSDAREMMMADVEKYGSTELNKIFVDYQANCEIFDYKGYLQGMAQRTAHRRQWLRFLAEYHILVMPTSLQMPMLQGFDKGGTAAVAEMTGMQLPLYLVNGLGLPSAAVPTGINDGVPLGVQIVGSAFREDLCLDAAQAIEDKVGILAERLWARD